MHIEVFSLFNKIISPIKNKIKNLCVQTEKEEKNMLLFGPRFDCAQIICPLNYSVTSENSFRKYLCGLLCF